MQRHFNNRNVQRPNFTRDGNINQSNSHRNKGSYDAYRDEDSSYRTREYHNTHRGYFKSNPYRHRQLPYDKHKSLYTRNPGNRDSFDPHAYSEPSTSRDFPMTDIPPMSPQEAKILRLINAVQSQKGINGLLVFLQTEKDNPTAVVQNAVQTLKNGVLSVLTGNKQQSYELRINGEFVVEGEFISKQAAKNGLCELALSELKKKCFLIVKKKNYEEISTEDINKSQTNLPAPSSMEGSKAHLMMLKMGWGGKGLGVNEQGAEKTVAETMTRSITKEGLGGKNIMNEINNILEEFARSAKVTTLAFDSGFTKDERAHIHNLAAKLNLKSKSEGKGEDRRITIGKKIAKWDLVKELLLVDCENDSYKLIIPSNFESMWMDE